MILSSVILVFIKCSSLHEGGNFLIIIKKVHFDKRINWFDFVIKDQSSFSWIWQFRNTWKEFPHIWYKGPFRLRILVLMSQKFTQMYGQKLWHLIFQSLKLSITVKTLFWLYRYHIHQLDRFGICDTYLWCCTVLYIHVNKNYT